MNDLESMLDQDGYDYTLDEDGNFVVNLVFDDERCQHVELQNLVAGNAGLQVWHISSVACDDVAVLKEGVLRSCLKNSYRHSLGAWELRDAELRFCVKTVVDYREASLRYLVNYVGAVADEFERKYIKADIN
ncbi:MAG: hypothetical protein Q4F00_03235 [bacterium]|nr:hypothetical protein [bacterium]